MSPQQYLTPTHERALIVRAQAGDIAARERVIVNIMPLLYRQANKIVAAQHCRADPENLVQEAAMRIQFTAEFPCDARKALLLS